MVSLRVGLLCHRGVGGSARIAVDLGNALAARGHTVHLFARTRPLGLDRFAAGVTFHPLVAGDGHAPPSAGLDVDWDRADMAAMADRATDVASRSGLDVLHFHYAVPFARIANEVRHRLRDGGPVVVGTLHGTDVSDCRPSRMPGVTRLLAGTDALTAVSRSHVRLAARTFGLARMPELIPNFVDVMRFRPLAEEHGPSARPMRVVHVSNFRPVKDPEAVVRVFLEVRRQVDAELWLVGDGEAMPSVVSAVRQAGLDRHVRFLGLHPAVESILPHSDVLLLTSRTESFSLVALEAAACGVAVVAPRVGGLPEVVVDGETGLLFEPGRERLAADAVVRVLSDARLRSAMRTLARRRARRFSSDALVPRYEALYRRLLAG